MAAKYDVRTERMSIRIPHTTKNHIWARAKKQKKSATDVVVDILTAAFKDDAPAPKWRPGTTRKGARHEREDVFA